MTTTPETAARWESPEAAGIDPAKLEALFERAAREVNDGLLPSAQIAVARHGKLVATRTFGSVTHNGQAAEATDSTLYCIFSCTKALTSAAIWMLIEAGKLDENELAADIVPEFGSNGKDVVTVSQLLTHTAGFPNAPFKPGEFLDRNKRLARFAKWRLEWEPGTRFTYHPSSSMYVLAEILERRSGVAYGDFVRQRIAEPLGLVSLWCGLPDDQHDRLADIAHVGEAMTEEDYAKLGMPVPPETEVTEDALQLFNRPEVRRAGIPGGGGTTTASDLALFYQALLQDLAGRGAGLWKSETIRDALRLRSGDLRDPMLGKQALRCLGLILSGDADRTYRGFGHTHSPEAFGHGGAGGQLAWADPVTGLSLGYCTNGHDRHTIRQGRRGVGISSRAAALLAD